MDAPSVVTKSGYVMEWCPTHPKASQGVYFQHRLVMEEDLGRFLTQQERVHHLNHDRTDNRRENLALHASHSEHLKEHWRGRGRRDPALVELVRLAAADPSKSLDTVRASPTTIREICRENGFDWVPCGQRGISRLLTEQSVREALRGRSTAQAATHLQVSAATLYERFGHLLTKRASPGALDRHAPEILRLVYKNRVSRTEVARRFGVHEVTLTKSIQRWLKLGAKPDGLDPLNPVPRYRGQRPGRKGPDKG